MLLSEANSSCKSSSISSLGVKEMSKESKEPGQTITLPDGRQLGYLIVGEGKPVFWFHGAGSCRLEVLVQKGTAGYEGLQIIGVDRPGFGLSTYHSGKSFRSFAADVSFLADHLGLERFQTVGISDGGHHVITCAALLATRLSRVVVLCGLSLPPDISGVSAVNKVYWRLATMPFLGTLYNRLLRRVTLQMEQDPDLFMKSKAGKFFLKDLPNGERKLFATPSQIREGILQALVSSYGQGSGSIRAGVQEARLVRKGWDVDLSQIPSGLVHIWHGTADRTVPVSNAYRNAKAIHGAHLKIFENEGHFFVLNHLQELGELLRS